MKLTASIVTYNSEAEIQSVLDSLILCNRLGLEIIVVDNASSDGTVNIVEKKFPNIKLIKLDKNIGFGAGHNVAIKEIDSDYHIFINPDIFVESKEIEKMITYMDSNLDTVILTPRVLNVDGTEQFIPKRYPKLKYFIGGKLENRFKFCYKWRSEYTLRDIKIEKPIEIDYCTGCFMFCRTEALKKCGGFDERYFLHFEDADLTRMMKKYGKTVFVPEIQVIHGWKRENAKLGKVFFIALQSMFKYIWKWRND